MAYITVKGDYQKFTLPYSNLLLYMVTSSATLRVLCFFLKPVDLR